MPYKINLLIYSSKNVSKSFTPKSIASSGGKNLGVCKPKCSPLEVPSQHIKHF